jgi:hypothetical protein
MSDQEPTTIRILLDEVRSEIGWAIAHDHNIKRSGQLWIEERIEAALALLDKARVEYLLPDGDPIRCVLIPDPTPFVSDSAPRGDTSTIDGQLMEMGHAQNPAPRGDEREAS